MHQKSSTKNSVNSMATVIVKGIVNSLIITIIAIGISAAIIMKELVSEEKIGNCAIVSILVAVTVGTTSVINKARKVSTALLVTASYVCVLLAMNALLFGGEYAGVGVSAALSLIGCSLAMLLTRRRNTKIKMRRIKIL